MLRQGEFPAPRGVRGHHGRLPGPKNSPGRGERDRHWGPPPGRRGRALTGPFVRLVKLRAALFFPPTSGAASDQSGAFGGGRGRMPPWVIPRTCPAAAGGDVLVMIGLPAFKLSQSATFLKRQRSVVPTHLAKMGGYHFAKGCLLLTVERFRSPRPRFGFCARGAWMGRPLLARDPPGRWPGAEGKPGLDTRQEASSAALVERWGAGRDAASWDVVPC